ncbi:MAG: hypothetical protein GF364_15130 [Candidatus Lokiarchaeota archaeon]|nr:hypothetical protein [Candidatus Lokiarchaeota archaeon]
MFNSLKIESEVDLGSLYIINPHSSEGYEYEWITTDKNSYSIFENINATFHYLEPFDQSCYFTIAISNADPEKTFELYYESGPVNSYNDGGWINDTYLLTIKDYELNIPENGEYYNISLLNYEVLNPDPTFCAETTVFIEKDPISYNCNTNNSVIEYHDEYKIELEMYSERNQSIKFANEKVYYNITQNSIAVNTSEIIFSNEEGNVNISIESSYLPQTGNYTIWIFNNESIHFNYFCIRICIEVISKQLYLYLDAETPESMLVNRFNQYTIQYPIWVYLKDAQDVFFFNSEIPIEIIYKSERYIFSEYQDNLYGCNLHLDNIEQNTSIEILINNSNYICNTLNVQLNVSKRNLTFDYFFPEEQLLSTTQNLKNEFLIVDLQDYGNISTVMDKLLVKYYLSNTWFNFNGEIHLSEDLYTLTYSFSQMVDFGFLPGQSILFKICFV